MALVNGFFSKNRGENPGIKSGPGPSIVITLVCIAAVLLLFLARPAILELLELKAYDLRFLSRDSSPAHPAIVLAVIDEKSLDALGRWPWPRSVIAALVNTLSAKGARVIGFDIGFLESEKSPFKAVMADISQRLHDLKIKDKCLNHMVSKARIQADNDLSLAMAIRASPSDIVLGYFFHMPEARQPHFPEDKAALAPVGTPRLSGYPLIFNQASGPVETVFINAAAIERVPDSLAMATPYTGYFNMAPDIDGVIRWLPLVIEYREDFFAPLSVVCAWLFMDRPRLAVGVDSFGVSGVQIGNRFVPTDETGQLLLNYTVPAQGFPTYAVTDIIGNTLSGNPFKDRIVIVGATAKGIGDTKTIPLGPDHPGMEIHATALNNILTGQFLIQSKWVLVYDLAAIVVMGLILGVLLPKVQAISGFCLAAGLFSLQVLVTQWVFNHLNIRINVVYPLLAITLTYTALTVHRYFSETREKKKVQRTFSRYASPQLIDEMIQNPNKLKLGGEVSAISVLFCDLANFTDISESRSPNDIINIMSQYFKEITDHVFAFKGTLKEYVGDELMALFGAPLYHRDHALNACHTALAIQAHLEDRRKAARKTGAPLLRARVGINSGDMLIGNLGSEYRFSYGAMGDNVNLGSRLEGLNKIYGTRIIIGENTQKRVRDHFLLRHLDCVRVKGKQKPVQVFELIGAKGITLPHGRASALSCYRKGLTQYLNRDWDGAMACFKDGLAAWPEDKAARVMIQRCLTFKHIPPPKEWDGVSIERRK